MADTERTISTLLGDQGDQEIRDLIYSMQTPAGSVILSAAATHIAAAVVTPWTSLCFQITPAPIKPMPTTTPVPSTPTGRSGINDVGATKQDDGRTDILSHELELWFGILEKQPCATHLRRVDPIEILICPDIRRTFQNPSDTGLLLTV